LQQLSTHMHTSAFLHVWFGENPNGIYGATPTDLMHAFLHGIIPYVIKIILSPFNNANKHCLDDLVDTTLVTVHSSQRINYPRCNFSCGISNLKLLTASEWAGVAFTIAIILTTEDGFNLFDKVFKQKKKRMNTDKKSRRRLLDMELNSDESNNLGLVHE